MRNYNDFDDFQPVKKDPLLPINDFRPITDFFQEPLPEPPLPKVNFEKDYEAARRYYDLGGGHEIITRG